MAHILFIDDDVILLKTVSIAIKKQGHTVQTATEIFSALDLIAKTSFDLIICDANLPVGPSGFEFVATFRAQPGHAKTPILFLTGRNKKTDVFRALQAGIDDYLIKPVNHKTLISKVETLLSRGSIGDRTLRATVETSEIWRIDLKIHELSMLGAKFTTSFEFPVNSKIKFNSELLTKIGLESPIVEIISSNRIENSDLFYVSGYFRELDGNQVLLIRNWIIDQGRKKVKAVI